MFRRERSSPKCEDSAKSSPFTENLPDPQSVRLWWEEGEKGSTPRRKQISANVSPRSRRSTVQSWRLPPSRKPASTWESTTGKSGRAAVIQPNEQLDTCPQGRSLGQVNAGNSSQQLLRNVMEYHHCNWWANPQSIFTASPAAAFR
jgi:hypothetical protein